MLVPMTTFIRKTKFGSFLQKARKKAGLSQIELASKLSYSSAQFVSNWERGLCTPPIDKLYQISQIMNIQPKSIFDIIMGDTEEYLRAELKIVEAKKKNQRMQRG